MTSSDFWTQERTDQAVRMWRSGISAGQVAAQMGTTRNAIIGKMARMGYKFDLRYAPVADRTGMPWSPEEIEKLRRLRDLGMLLREIAAQIGRSYEAVRDKAKDLNLGSVRTTKRAAKKAPGNTLSIAAPAMSTAPRPNRVVSLMDLGAMQCKFPFGDVGQDGFGFCGERVAIAGAAYCPCHMALAYRPAGNRRAA